MFNLRIVALGKAKEHAPIDEYITRLKPYAKVGLLEIPEEPFRDISEKEKIQEKEARKLLKHIPDGSFVIALHEHGKEYTSEKLAAFLKEKSAQGDVITFLIGGPLGWHESVLQRAHLHLSLSRLTLPHQLARIVLLEQLYRAATIINGKQYHY
jgi:23S rRNA (pseudouridine1915-N3)-methyltransferase